MLTASEWRDYCAENDIDTEGLDKGANTDWFDEIMRVGITHNHDLSLSGGANNHNYRASVSYQEREGIVKGNYQNRLNARLTFNQKGLDDRLNVTVTGAITERDYSPAYTDNFVLAYNMLPVYPVKNSDGSWFDSEEYDQGNPVRNIEYNKYLHKNNLYYLNGKADLEVLKGLVAGVNVLKERENDDYGVYYSPETGFHKLNFLAEYSYELKLRAGYGVSGNQDGLDPYQSLELYGSSGQYYDDGKWYTAYQISQNANPDLKWEETSMFNVGVRLGFCYYLEGAE